MRNSSNSLWRHVKISGLVAFILTTIGGAVALTAAKSKPPVDESDLCQRHAALRESRVVLVDATDPFSQNQQRQLRSAILSTRDRTPIDSKLILLLLDAAAPYEPRELIAKCNPGSSADSNPLFNTVKRVDKKWRDAFGTPIDDAVTALGSAAPSSVSPLIESITSATQRPDFDGRVEKRSLLLVSDLLQHSGGPGGYSQYNASTDLWAEFRRSRLVTEAQPDLKNVDVEIVYLTRPDAAKFQSHRHREFWRKWFMNAGAASVRFVGIPADSPEASSSPSKSQKGSRSVGQLSKPTSAKGRVLKLPSPEAATRKVQSNPS